MKLTLDRMCIQTKKLCTTCQNLMDKGEISEFDIELGNVLMNLAKSNKYLNDLTVLKLVETDLHVFVIVQKGQIAKVKRAENQISAKLENILKRKIIYLEKTKSPRVLLDFLLHPIKVISNSIMIIPPDGDKEIKVQIKKKFKEEVPISMNEASKLTKALLGMDTHFVYI